MSASEKLRSLATAWRTGEYDMVTVKPTTVLDALPQIVAVVEAAEGYAGPLARYGYVDGPVVAALVALDEALSTSSEAAVGHFAGSGSAHVEVSEPERAASEKFHRLITEIDEGLAEARRLLWPELKEEK